MHDFRHLPVTNGPRVDGKDTATAQSPCETPISGIDLGKQWLEIAAVAGAAGAGLAKTLLESRIRESLDKPAPAAPHMHCKSKLVYDEPMNVTITRDGKVIWQGGVIVGDIDRRMPEEEWRHAMRAEAINSAIEDGVFKKAEDADDCEFVISEE